MAIDLNNIDLMDKGLIARIISEIRSSENTDRKVQAWEAYQIASGNVLPYVVREVQARLPQTAKSMTISDISISGKVTNKIARSYKEGPIRKLQNDEQTKSLNELYDKMGANKSFSEYDTIRTLHRYVLMWVNWYSETGLILQALNPFEFDVLRDSDTGILKMVVLQYPDSTITNQTPERIDRPRSDSVNQAISNFQDDSAASTRTYVFWTKDQHVIVKAKFSTSGKVKGDPISIDFVPIESNPNNINPLGVLPFVYSDVGGNQTDYPIINPITSQTITYNVMKSDVLSAATLQGYGIRTLSGTAEILANTQILHEGLTTASKLVQPDEPGAPETKLEFVNPGPDLAGQMEVYNSYLREVLSQAGIEGTTGMRGSEDRFNSGFERVIANADTQEIIQSNQNDFSQVEKNVFEIIKVWQDVVLKEIKFSADSELEIHYPRPQVLISDKETLENIDKRLTMGLIDKAEALMLLNPNLTREQAEEKSDEIEQKKMERAAAFGLMPGMAPSQEEEGDDDNGNET